jgi:hypothetical protein
LHDSLGKQGGKNAKKMWKLHGKEIGGTENAMKLKFF